MALEQIALIAEIIGVLVVAVTLVFLTIQIRQNNSMLRSAATQHAHSQYADIFNSIIGDPKFLEIYLQASKGTAELSEIEMVRMNAYWMKCTVNYQNWFLQTRDGALEGSVMASYERLFKLLGGTETWKLFWKERKEVFHEDLVTHVDKIMSTLDSKPYKPFGVYLNEV